MKPLLDGQGQPITTEERKAKAIAMRVQGHSFSAIGAVIGTDASAASKLVKTTLKARGKIAEDVAELRQLELDRLDRDEEDLSLLRLSVNPATRIKAIGLRLKVSARRAEMLGLDAPKAFQVTGAGGEPLLDVERQRQYLDNPDAIKRAIELDALLAARSGQATAHGNHTDNGLSETPPGDHPTRVNGFVQPG